MTTFISTLGEHSLHAINAYPRKNQDCIDLGLSGKRNEEMRSMTIAAFRVSQNTADLSDAPMDYQRLRFLLAGSDSAINHWITKGRLIREGGMCYLTDNGLDECEQSLLHEPGQYSTSEEKVAEWTTRMLQGDEVTQSSRSFSF